MKRNQVEQLVLWAVLAVAAILVIFGSLVSAGVRAVNHRSLLAGTEAGKRLVGIIIAADHIKTAHDFLSPHNRHHSYSFVHSPEMLLQQRDIGRKFIVHCEAVGACQRTP